MDFLEIYYTDVYKTGHKPMLPKGSTLMYSNTTPRSGKHANFSDAKGIINGGQQKMVRQMNEDWKTNFFDRPIEEIEQFGRDLTAMLMLAEPFDISHFKELHELGYLPLKVKALKEGTFVPYGVPITTVVNTKPLNGAVVDWLVNYLETIQQAESWQFPTSATLSFEFRKNSHKWVSETDPENMWLIDYMNHDFSMRGQQGKSAIVNSGLGWAFCSKGSDTLPVIPASRKYYDEPLDDVCINSVMASEHAIMCSLTGFFMKNSDGDWNKVADFEYEMFVYLLKKFPSGTLSLVMDTWDLWRSIEVYCRKAKDIIMARDGKLVIRPDSGNPVDIICGINSNPRLSGDVKYFEDLNDLATKGTDKRSFGNARINKSEFKGVIELLWDIFGGTTNYKGYKVLDSHIGAIYGDSITLDRQTRIYERLAYKKFASTNIVLGVGSYSLAMVSRDTHGFAQKATYIEVNGLNIEVFKDPVTSVGTNKKSAKGLMTVSHDINGDYKMIDQVDWNTEDKGELQVIFKDGEFYNQTTLTEIRERINGLLLTIEATREK